ncbi:wall-associated receptor kinase 2-like [Durio zibethinus]|uniref:Wall-associated receptor kinase 2-like n=1 Tax=Durio zibethinus TaxID=66656 RepID=A0A6P6B811_DURZI|nr:wall-associated receptor kinase 2-like [Durio zibethinus]
MGLRCMFKELALFAVKLTIIATSVAAQAKPGCQSNCGNISIPYPFGTDSPGCNISDDFYIRCDNTVIPPKAYLTTSNIEVLNISVDGYLRILGAVGYACYNSSGRSSDFGMWMTLSKFPISHSRNKFTAIGCDTYAFIRGSLGHKYSTGCVIFCNDPADVINGSCSGIGCCQTAIPKGVRSYNLSFLSGDFHSDVLSFNPCSYGFVVEDGAYNFSVSDLNDTNFRYREVPFILDWAIGNQSCKEAETDPENYACKDNSYCNDAANGPGYLCKCLDGFQGNPYLSHGCQDINECDTLKPCNGTCHNVLGSYNCSCPEGFEGDGRKNGTGCRPKVSPHRRSFPIPVVALGIGIGLFALLLGITLTFLMLRQRQIAKLREKYFRQNGGNLLQEHLSQREGCGEKVKVFAAEELEKATNSYHESTFLGQGGQGTVYKGTLPDGRVVAIKKSRIGDHSQVEPFINEITVLYQINHRNVVKLLGCCLETPVPLLVYEYVTKGSLFDHMHNVAAPFLPWEARLKIATETAEALSYLHSAASIPIIHRDIKLANILLDDNYTAKVSDFGASRLIPSDHAQVITIVQGTFGYLDPEYMHTGQLTEKSDVYSFGVLLIELLTGQKAVCFKRSEEKKLLAVYFVSLMKEERLLEILDPRVLNDGNIEHLKEVAALAWRCVRVKGEERPTMKEVAHELAGMQAMERHPWGKSNLHAEETEYLLGELRSTYTDGATNSSMGYDSINNQVPFELEGAR